jgi:transcriptional regulator with XRE-family HTH domain
MVGGAESSIVMSESIPDESLVKSEKPSYFDDMSTESAHLRPASDLGDAQHKREEESAYKTVDKAYALPLYEKERPKKLKPAFKDMLPTKEKGSKNLEELITSLDESFSETLFRLIDAKGMSDAQVYKAANIDRRLFSKIRIGKGYMPSKKTALALAIALRLSREETDSLLGRAGYVLSRSQIQDVIVEYFISRERYNIFEINEVLFSYDQQLLGS